MELACYHYCAINHLWYFPKRQMFAIFVDTVRFDIFIIFLNAFLSGLNSELGSFFFGAFKFKSLLGIWAILIDIRPTQRDAWMHPPPPPTTHLFEPESFKDMCFFIGNWALTSESAFSHETHPTFQSFSNEPPNDKTNKMTCAPLRRLGSAWASAQSDQSSAVHMKKHWAFSYPLSAQWRLLSDWVDAQADLSLRWAQGHSVGFDVLRFKLLSHFPLGLDVKQLKNSLCKTSSPLISRDLYPVKTTAQQCRFYVHHCKVKCCKSNNLSTRALLD